MKRFIAHCCLCLFLTLSMNVYSQGERKNKPTDLPTIELTLSAEGDTLRVQNAGNDSTLEIYNVLGVKVKSIKIDSPDKTIQLNLPKGCYILKIEDIARKIAIK